jgi:hypothetical protein
MIYDEDENNPSHTESLVCAEYNCCRGSEAPDEEILLLRVYSSKIWQNCFEFYTSVVLNFRMFSTEFIPVMGVPVSGYYLSPGPATHLSRSSIEYLNFLSFTVWSETASTWYVGH